ncbi:Selenoprotein M-like [Homarus americanus]|uniref:Selenoprotein M-like n=1 Tax=Homarus americanus TaxID=6706 RepID=A0A8J5JPJ6_HOMAM|nr:Selenoprotein M-like [Homarus americanus]
MAIRGLRIALLLGAVCVATGEVEDVEDKEIVRARLEVVERVPLEKFNREECNQVLLKKGFYKKSDKDEEVPEEFRTGPYKEKEEL